VTTYGGYPAGGCVLRDKLKCKLPAASCCDEGMAVRRAQQVRMVEHGREVLAGYDCPDHPGPLDDARDHVCRLRPVEHRARLAAENDTGDSVGALRATHAAAEADGWRGWVDQDDTEVS
jgi:hypothetical protein